MENKKRGPVTVPGKKASSRNAIKHGATSPRLINEAEQERYQLLLSNLEHEYSSTNPLIELQLERIARITIQLERMQDVIDAVFKKSRARANSTARLMESLKKTNAQLDVLAGKLFNNKNIKQVMDSRRIAYELINAGNIIEIESEEKFYDKLPLLTSYITTKEKMLDTTVNKFLISEVGNLSVTHKEICETCMEADQLVLETEDVELNQLNIEAIKKANLTLLKLFAIWHRSILKDLIVGTDESNNMQESIEFEEQAILPDSGEMDRLMRYQTTLQRQLSAAIGELLILTKI